MFKLWFVELLLLLSMCGALALDGTSEFPQENGQNEDITGDELVPITLPQHQDNAIDTQSCYPDMCGVLADLDAIQSRLAAAERQMEELRSENKGKTDLLTT